MPQSDDELGYFLSDNEYADMEQDTEGYSNADEEIIDQYKRLDETISSDEINEILNQDLSNIPITVLENTISTVFKLRKEMLTDEKVVRDQKAVFAKMLTLSVDEWAESYKYDFKDKIIEDEFEQETQNCKVKFNRLDPTQHKELVAKYNQTFESMKKIFYADPSVDQIAMEQKLIQIGFVHHDVVGMDEPDQGDTGELTENSLPSDHIFSDQSANVKLRATQIQCLKRTELCPRISSKVIHPYSRMYEP